MSFHNPITKEEMALFSDLPKEQAMFRIVVKQNLTRPLATDLIDAIAATVHFLDLSGPFFRSVHIARNEAAQSQPSRSEEPAVAKTPQPRMGRRRVSIAAVC